ncbi:MAG: hypothetical protein V2I39_07630 [Erythrobacter sp.]|jgi:hypothetical protein|nr:hypothetical protein [Erythrobacter sp.]
MQPFSSELIVRLQSDRNAQWVASHVDELRRLLPDFAAMYPLEDFQALVIRLLNRAELRGLRERDTTVAFCVASIKLGVGFDESEGHEWFGEALEAPEDARAGAIWRGLADALETDPEGAA